MARCSFALLLTSCHLAYEHESVPNPVPEVRAAALSFNKDLRVTGAGAWPALGRLYVSEERVISTQDTEISFSASEESATRGWQSIFLTKKWFESDAFPLTGLRGGGLFPVACHYPFLLTQWYHGDHVFPVTHAAYNNDSYTDVAAALTPLYLSGLVLFIIPPVIDTVMSVALLGPDVAITASLGAFDVSTLATGLTLDAVTATVLAATDAVTLTSALTMDTLALGFSTPVVLLAGMASEPPAELGIHEIVDVGSRPAADMSIEWFVEDRPESTTIVQTDAKGYVKLDLWPTIAEAMVGNQSELAIVLRLASTKGEATSDVQTRAALTTTELRSLVLRYADALDKKTGPVDPWLYDIATKSEDAALALKLKTKLHGRGLSLWPDQPWELKLAPIPPGTGSLGTSTVGVAGRSEVDPDASAADEPSRPYRMDAFKLMAEVEVTQATYDYVAQHRVPSPPSRQRQPARSVTFDEAEAFCASLSTAVQSAGLPFVFRLPDEDEWEYVCRAGSPLPINLFEVDGTPNYRPLSERLREIAFFESNSRHGPQTVGQLRPNRWGFHDFHGNVCEWCRPSKSLPPVPAHAAPTRGGGWTTSYQGCRSSNRDVIDKASAKPSVGFRVLAEWVR